MFNFIKKYSDYIFAALLILFSVIYIFMSVKTHLNFETYGWDLGVFDQGIWQWSKFIFPYSSFTDLPWLADHFHPILVLVAPFYWIYSSSITLVSVQALVTCLGAIPLYLLSKRVTKNRLFSLVLSLAYFLFYSLQWSIFSGFHELAFLPLTLGFVMYFYETRSTKLYWLSFVLALLVKEEIGLLLGTFGVWILFNDRRRWRQALASIIFGFGTTAFLVMYLMPAIAGGAYRHSGFGVLGFSFTDVVINIIKNPGLLIKAFVDSPVKINTMFVTFWPFIFLPFFAPGTLILVIQQFAVRFVDYEKVIRWTPYFVYSLPMATIMAWGSIYGFRNLQKFLKRYGKKVSKILMFTVISVLFLITGLQQILLHAPINSIFKRSFYRNEKWMDDNRKVIGCVPKVASVSAQNNLAPWLSERKYIKVFPEGLIEGYGYVIVDLHKGQSENSFSFFGSEKTGYVINDLLAREFYEITCKEGDAILLNKIHDTEGKLNYGFPLEIYEK
jgi:uncharacterized membrane protein